MAEEEVVGAPEVVVADNSNKRKLDELELTEHCGDGAAEADAENGDKDDIDKGLEAKRSRLEEESHAADNGFEKEKDNNGPKEEVSHLTGDGHEESKEVPEHVSSEHDVGDQQSLIGTEEPAEQTGDFHEESKEVPDSEHAADDGQQPPIGIEELVDVASQDLSKEETSKEDGNEFVADVAKGANGEHEVDLETVSQKMEVPNNRVGVLIGKAGDTIRYLQYNSGAKIQITRDTEADPRSTSRPVELIGTLESIKKAEKLIKDVIAEADAGGSPSLIARGFSTVQAVTGEQVEIQVPNEKAGMIIGKGGETIKNLQTTSGARIQLIPQHPPEGDQSKERTVRVTGDRKQIEIAREMIKEVMNQIWLLHFTSGQHCLGVAIDNSYSLSPAKERYQALVLATGGI